MLKDEKRYQTPNSKLFSVLEPFCFFSLGLLTQKMKVKMPSTFPPYAVLYNVHLFGDSFHIIIKSVRTICETVKLC